MAVSSTYAWNPTVDEIGRRGMQLAGLLPLGRTIPTDQAGHVREMLEDSVKALANEGVGLTQWENTTLTLTAGVVDQVTTTALPADTLSVDFPMMIAPAGEVSQSSIQRYVWEQYQYITNKATQGRPTTAYIETGHALSVKWWPVPDAAYIVSYRRERLARDASSGTTPDFKQRWTDALVYVMAEKLALAGSLGAERCRLLGEKAAEAVQKAKGREHEDGDVQMILECY